MARVITPNRYPWMVVGMLWFVTFFNYADRQALFSVFPLLEKEMHLSMVQLGLLGSAFAWVYGLGAPAAGLIVDHVRRKTAILTGLQIWSFICSATALSHNFGQLMLFRAAEGAGEAIYYPAAVSILSDYHGQKTRSRALGLLVTSVYLGTVGGGTLAGLLGQRYGWRAPFLVFGGLGVVLGLVLRRTLREPERGAADDRTFARGHPAIGIGNALRKVLSSRAVLLLMAAFVCANFVAVVLLSWMPTFLHDRFGLSLAAAGLSATLFAQIASMAGAIVGGWLADHFVLRTGRARVAVQAAGVFCGAPFVALCGFTQSLTWLMVALSGWGFFKGLYDANIFASAFDVVSPEMRGTVTGLMNCFGWLLGGGAAPVVVGLIASKAGLGLAIATTSLVYVSAGLILTICLIFFINPEKKALAANDSYPPGRPKQNSTKEELR